MHQIEKNRFEGLFQNNIQNMLQIEQFVLPGLSLGSGVLLGTLESEVSSYLKINSSSHNIGTNQNPNLTSSERSNGIIPLQLRSFWMYDIDMYFFFNQFIEELFGPVFFLNKYQDRWP